MIKSIKLTENNIDITSSVYGHFIQIQFRLDEKEKAEQLKQQILKNQEITTLCQFLDFDAILFALNRDLRFKHKNDPESHLHLKIRQIKQLREILGNNNT